MASVRHVLPSSMPRSIRCGRVSAPTRLVVYEELLSRRPDAGQFSSGRMSVTRLRPNPHATRLKLAKSKSIRHTSCAEADCGLAPFQEALLSHELADYRGKSLSANAIQ